MAILQIVQLALFLLLNTGFIRMPQMEEQDQVGLKNIVLVQYQMQMVLSLKALEEPKTILS